MAGIVPILIGLVLLVVAWVCWTGRWRSWAKIAMLPSMPITALPGLGLMFVAIGVGESTGSIVRGLCFVVAVLAPLAGMVLWMWDPDWYGPRWYRDRDREYDLSVPLNAAVAASVRTDPGAHASEAVARQRMGGREPLARWRAHLVSDAHGRPSAMQRIGLVRGHLLLYPAALVFAADVREDRMRGRPVVQVIGADDIFAVRRAPAGSRPDGSRSGPDLPSRVMPRVRLETAEGPVVFEMANAGRRIRELEERYLGMSEQTTAAG